MNYQLETKRVVLMFFLGLLISTVACSRVQQAQTKVQRTPLEKQQREYKSPVNYAPREVGYDPKTGKPIAYDHKPRVELVDAKAGKYLFKWIGYDGKEKRVVFQRADAIEVTIAANASRTSDGRYTYSYNLQNLQSSGTYLSGFTIQNFSSDANAVMPRGGYIGRMSSVIPQFKEGNWIYFGATYFERETTPGRQITVTIGSTAPPGVVGCRVTGGQLELSGADEDMPAVLEDMLPGYDDWPWGYTIGPVDYLKTLSAAEKIKYLLDQLPVFKRAGWITDQALQQYQAQLKNGNLEAVSAEAEEDLKAEQITTEVFAIIHGLK